MRMRNAFLGLLVAMGGLLIIPSQLTGSEFKAIALEEEAKALETRALQEKNPEIRKDLETLARFKREDASIEREKNFRKPQLPVIHDTQTKGSQHRVFLYQEQSNTTWELAFGYGSGGLLSSRGREWLNDPYSIVLARGSYYPRTSLAYDNYTYYNIGSNRNNYPIHPINLKITRWNNQKKYGWSWESRSFQKDASYTAIHPQNPNHPYNALQTADYNWSETKASFQYRDNLDYNKGFTVILGIRSLSTAYQESAYLPFLDQYRKYKDVGNTVGPNIGLSYSQNFYGLLVFTSGLEVSAGGGGLFYDSTVLRGKSSATGNANFSILEHKKPIDLVTFGGEFYGKFDFILNDRHRLGLGLNYHHFFRITESRRLPHILSNEWEQIARDYESFAIRNLLYNEDKNNQARFQILRWISLEYTHVF